ncbi:MAG: (d)CMP kinase [Alphaproteobacteria bacterium]|nr:(d)CMP kinase [Alphaproteobacteria bacterium]
MSTSFTPIIAIDGLSASGKGTLARRVAEKLDFAWLDTGLLYRAAGLMALEAGASLDDMEALEAFAKRLNLKIFAARLDDPALRGDEAAQAASKVGACAPLRAALLKFQQDFAHHPPDGKEGAVLDGRDIGTVVVPEAPVKIFVTAGVETRAKRRFKELRERGEDVSESAVLADMRARDERDQTRATAPAKPAPDAVVLDTTSMNADEAFAAVLAIVEEKLHSA